MKSVFEVIIVVCLLTTVGLFFTANRIDHKRRIKGWNGTPFTRAEYSGNKRTSRLLRMTCLVLIGVAVLAIYGFVFFG